MKKWALFLMILLGANGGVFAQGQDVSETKSADDIYTRYIQSAYDRVVADFWNLKKEQGYSDEKLEHASSHPNVEKSRQVTEACLGNLQKNVKDIIDGCFNIAESDQEDCLSEKEAKIDDAVRFCFQEEKTQINTVLSGRRRFPHGVRKPIIYLYPEKDTNITIRVGKPQNLTYTYPLYQNGWSVSAKPNGDLTDEKTGRYHYALYWEGVAKKRKAPQEGFVVAGRDTISFLEEKLADLGLTEREADEFIIYWLPKLEKSAYNFIRFQTMEEQNNAMPLFIVPKPETLIRVMMEYDDLEEPIHIQEQKLPPKPVRQGFTVVEWGGTKIEVKSRRDQK